MYRWRWDVGGEKDKDKKKEVCEKWHTSGMNERRKKKKKHAHTTFSKKQDFLFRFLSHVNDKSVFGLQSEWESN